MATINHLVPFAHVADVQRSIDFYGKLGFEVTHSMSRDSGEPFWAFLKSNDAELMVARASAPIVPGEQAILFYLYTDDVVALREELAAADVPVGEITHPDHMPAGELRLEDPDGYTLLIGQLEG